MGSGRVDDPDIAYGTGTQDLDFLRTGEKFGVNPLRQLHCTGQVQDLPLGFRQSAHLPAQLGEPRLEPRPLIEQGAIGRMRGVVALSQFVFIALDPGQFTLDPGDLLQNGLCL